MELTRNSDLVEMGVDEFAKAPVAKKEKTIKPVKEKKETKKSK